MRWYWGVFRVVTGHCWGCSFFWGGRKDCFPGADGSTIQQTESANAATIKIYGANGNTLTEGSVAGLQLVNITTSGVLGGNNCQVYTVKKPLAFIYNATSPYDWYTDNETYQNDALWGEGVDKSDFDPCPIGWRVPSSGTWNDFTRNSSTPSMGTFPYYIKGIIKEDGYIGDFHTSNGRMYKMLAWYPAGGWRDPLSGTCGNTGTGGPVWSFSYDSSFALDLGFNMNNLNIRNLCNRAFGISVRCVQE